MKAVTAEEREALLVAADPHGNAMVACHVRIGLVERGLIVTRRLSATRWRANITDLGRLALRVDARARGVSA